MTASPTPTIAVEERPHFGFECSACGPYDGVWRSAQDAEWAGAAHLYWQHGGKPVHPEPLSRRTSEDVAEEKS